MTNNAAQHSIARIRKLLLAAFTPEELRRFCYDRASFRPVVNRFGPGLGLDDMVDELIIYCDRYVFVDQLLAEIRQVNPGQYARHFGSEPAGTVTATPAGETKTPPGDVRAEFTPEILTITSPISLDLVRVPAGEFLMGSVAARDEHAWNDEFPPHRVRVPEFHIGMYPVTNLQYQAFVKATGSPAPDRWESGEMPRWKGNHPVANMPWRDAVSFCTWLREETGHSFRLPTEAEWEKAARGTDGRIWPWGDEPPDEGRCNFGKNVGKTTPIGRYSPQGDSFYGCAEMAGNVWEWCQSLYKPYPYRAGDGREADSGGGHRVLRGGSFRSHPGRVRSALRFRYDPDHWYPSVGFRVAMGLIR